MSGRLSPRFVSWLDEALEQFPQAKATADQVMAYLRKKPQVSMEEVADRGLDQFLGQQQGSVTMPQVFQHLQSTPNLRPDPVDEILSQDYLEWSTPGLGDYAETVRANPAWDPRYGSLDHFPEAQGYQYHTRGGVLPNTNLGAVRVLDEVQQDIRPVTKQFNPMGVRMPDSNRLGELQLEWNSWAGTDAPRASEVIAHPEIGTTFANARGALDDAEAMYEDNPAMLDLIGDIRAENADYNQPYNMPARTRYEWQGMARELQKAVADERDALVWPSSDVQYKRYFQRGPEAYQQRLDDPEGLPPIMISEAKQALGSLDMYRNQYDKRMPRDKRWKQLGLEPELVDLESIKPINSANALSTESSKPVGKYWAVRLTPEIRERLAKSGIPYYSAGGMAVLGQQDGAFDQ